MSDNEKATLQKVGTTLSTATKYLMMPSLAVLGYVGKLMQNEFIFDGGKMEEMLNNIWVLMRDIVNVISSLN
ncbi:MAG: hypothetical protein ABIK92_16730 [Pseudomonadota bacterium]